MGRASLSTLPTCRTLNPGLADDSPLRSLHSLSLSPFTSRNISGYVISSRLLTPRLPQLARGACLLPLVDQRTEPDLLFYVFRGQEWPVPRGRSRLSYSVRCQAPLLNCPIQASCMFLSMVPTLEKCDFYRLGVEVLSVPCQKNL
jgi:hypothetical protein